MNCRRYADGRIGHSLPGVPGFIALSIAYPHYHAAVVNVTQAQVEQLVPSHPG